MKLASDAASQEFGVNRKLLSKNFFQLRKDITQFGHLSDIELMRVASRATQLGVEMKDLSGVFNKFGTFEDAANSAALLSQTFGMNIDALQLIRAEDPTEIVEMFRNSMLATGRSFDDLNRHEKSLMATHTGMSVEALKTTMNYRTLGKSYEEIKEIMNNQKPEERQIRAMKDMKTSMSEIQKIMDKKDFFTAFTDGLTKTILYNTQLGKSFIGINKQMERFYENGLNLNKTQKVNLDKILKPFAGIVDEIKEIFSIKSLNNAKNEILSNLGKFITSITITSEKYLGKDFYKYINKTWSSKFEKMFSLENIVESNSFFARLARASGKIIGYILRAFVALGPGLIKGIGNAFKSVLEFIANPNSTIFTSKRLMKFLGFKNLENFNNFTKSMTIALKDLRSYLFGNKDQKGIFSQIYEQLQQIFSLEKGASLFRSLGKSIGEGLIDAVKGSGGLRNLIYGDRPPGVNPTPEQVAKARKDDKQMNRIVDATVNQGFVQGGLEATNQLANSYIGDEGLMADIKWGLGETVDLLGDFSQVAVSMITSNPLARAATETINYKIKNDKSSDMVNQAQKEGRITDEERRKVLEKATDDQASSSITKVALGALGTIAAGLVIGTSLPVLATAGIAAAVGAAGVAAGDYFFDDAEESAERSLKELEEKKLKGIKSASVDIGPKNYTLDDLKNLDGDARLTREDIDILTQNNKEHTDKIIKALLDSHQKVIRVDLDGNEIASVVTVHQARSAKDASLVTNGYQPQGASNRASMVSPGD